jgi:hypothetical protein
MAVPNPTQQAWRFISDDGPEPTATPLAAADTAPTINSGVLFRIRFALIMDTWGGKTTGYQLQRKLNAGAWANVDAASTVVRATASANLSEGGNTSRRLVAGYTYESPNHQIDMVDGVTASLKLVYNHCVDVECAVLARSADVAAGDTVWLRLLDTKDGDVMGGAFTDASFTVGGSLTAHLTETLTFSDALGGSSDETVLSESLGLLDHFSAYRPPDRFLTLHETLTFSDYWGPSAVPPWSSETRILRHYWALTAIEPHYHVEVRIVPEVTATE